MILVAAFRATHVEEITHWLVPSCFVGRVIAADAHRPTTADKEGLASPLPARPRRPQIASRSAPLWRKRLCRFWGLPTVSRRRKVASLKAAIGAARASKGQPINFHATRN